MIYNKLFSFLIRNNIKGKDRLYAIFQKSGFSKYITVKAKYDISLSLNPHEYIDSIIIREGFYESEVTDAILSQLKASDTFWDVGSNIGIHSIAIKKNRPDINVVCFEPSPKTLGLLHINVALNKLQVDICGFALYNQIGISTLYIVEGNSGMSTLTPWGIENYKTSVKCQTLTGNYLIENGFTIPAVMKIDTEGSELEVLKGCAELLSSPVLKSLILELGNGYMEEDSDIKTFLSSFNFTKVEKLKRNEKTHHTLSNFIISKEA